MLRDLLSGFFGGLAKAVLTVFPRYFVTVGFVLLFIPRYIPAEAHAAWHIFIWSVYLVTPFVLWKLFDRFENYIEKNFVDTREE
jgi:hypothetical protein